MAITFKPLHNRVARRIVLLFILAAVIPLGILAGLTMQLVSSELQQQGEMRLHENAKSMGMKIFDRLQFLSEQLQLLGHQIQRHQPGRLDAFEPLMLAANRRIEGLFRITAQGRLYRLFGKVDAEGPQLLQAIHDQWIPGKSLLLLRAPRTQKAPLRLFLFNPLGSQQLDGELLGAQLNIERLWDIEQIRDRPEQICILSEQGAPLYCNRQVPEEWLASVVARTHGQNSGQYVWEHETDQQLTAFWSLFLAPHYQLEKWTLAIGMAEEEALAPVHKFQTLLPRVVLLAMLLVVMLSIPIIRSNLHPLERLLAATRRLSQGQFDARVQLSSGDEFQEVGESFNQMALQLGCQFEHQRLLAEIGRQLQQAASVDVARNAIINGLNGLNPVSAVAAVTLDSRDRGHYLDCCPFFPTLKSHPQESELCLQEKPLLPERIWQGTGGAMVESFPALRVLQARADWRLTLVPAVKEGEILALLALTLRDDRPLDDETRALLLQMSDLLAVTLSNIYLDSRLYYQAHHDHLTGLPNRLLLKQRAELALTENAITGESCAVIIFDIDRFKLVNDTQGHAAGDELLSQVARRLQNYFRPEDTISRFAGDEFVILLRDMNPKVAQQQVIHAIERIDQAFYEPFSIGNWVINATASKGAVLFPQDGDNFHELLSQADSAMYHAKENRPGSYALFSAELKASISQKVMMERALAGAAERGEFVLHYQPVVDIRQQSVVSAEALIRWQRPGEGLVMPEEFIGIAEETGLIEEIGDWALNQVCRDFRGWLDQGMDLDHVSVNVSGLQLDNRDFVSTVEQVLDTNGLEAKYLELEVTETALIGNFEQSVAKLRALRSSGLKIAVDDFGTGYSSLKYMKSLPADRLKIDRLFVRELPDNKRDAAIISSLVTLSRELGFELLAEGVETERQAEFLRAASIHSIQGYLYSIPLPASGFLEFVKQQNSAAKMQIVTSGGH